MRAFIYIAVNGCERGERSVRDRACASIYQYCRETGVNGVLAIELLRAFDWW